MTVAFGAILITSLIIYPFIQSDGQYDEIATAVAAVAGAAGMAITGGRHQSQGTQIGELVVRAGRITDAYNRERLLVVAGVKMIPLENVIEAEGVIDSLLEDLRRAGQIEVARDLADSLLNLQVAVRGGTPKQDDSKRSGFL